MADIDVYIESYCKKEKVDAETAKTHAIVKEVAKYYKDAKKGKITVEEIKAGCGSAGQGGE